MSNAKDVEREKRRAYKGKIRVRLEALNSTREFDRINVDRIKDIFTTDRAQQFSEPIKVTVSHDLLQESLRAAELDADQLINQDLPCPPELDFEPGTLDILHGVDRFQAAKECHLRWWTVELYLADLNSLVRRTIIESYTNEKLPSTGECYLKIVEYKANGDLETELLWWSRLRGISKKNVKSLLERRYLDKAFKDLCVIPGLWHKFNASVLHTILALKSDEELINYLQTILRIFKTLVGEERDALRRIDKDTIDGLERRAPQASTSDAEYVSEQMGRRLFRKFTVNERTSILSRIKDLPQSTLILSLATFFDDCHSLQAWVGSLRWLFRPMSRETMKLAIESAHAISSQVRGEQEIHVVLLNGTALQLMGTSSEHMDLGRRQLYAFAMRWYHCIPHQTQPRKEKARPIADMALLKSFADLAARLGYGSRQVSALQAQQPSQSGERLRDAEEPVIFSSGHGELMTHRSGTLNPDSFSKARHVTSLDRLHASDVAGGEGIGPAFVYRSQYLAFFGPLDPGLFARMVHARRLPLPLILNSSRASSVDEEILDMRQELEQAQAARVADGIATRRAQDEKESAEYALEQSMNREDKLQQEIGQVLDTLRSAQAEHRKLLDGKDREIAAMVEKEGVVQRANLENETSLRKYQEEMAEKAEESRIKKADLEKLRAAMSRASLVRDEDALLIAAEHEKLIAERNREMEAISEELKSLKASHKVLLADKHRANEAEQEEAQSQKARLGRMPAEEGAADQARDEELARLLSSITRQAALIAQKEREIEALKMELTEQKTSYDVIFTEIERSKAAGLKEARASAASSEQHLKAANQTIHELRGQLQAAIDETWNSQKQGVGVGTQTFEDVDLDDVDHALERDQITQLQIQLALMTDTLTEQQTQSRGLLDDEKARSQRLGTLCETLQGRLERLESEAARSSDLMQEVKDELATRRAELATRLKLCDEQGTQIQDLQTDLKIERDRSQSLLTSQAVLGQQVTRQLKDAQLSHERTTSLEGQIQQLETEGRQIADKLQDLEAQLQSKKEQIAAITSANEEMSRQIEATNTRRDRAATDNTVLRGQAQRKDRELTEVRRAKALAEEDSAEWRAKALKRKETLTDQHTSVALSATGTNKKIRSREAQNRPGNEKSTAPANLRDNTTVVVEEIEKSRRPRRTADTTPSVWVEDYARNEAACHCDFTQETMNELVEMVQTRGWKLKDLTNKIISPNETLNHAISSSGIMILTEEQDIELMENWATIMEKVSKETKRNRRKCQTELVSQLFEL